MLLTFHIFTLSLHFIIPATILSIGKRYTVFGKFIPVDKSESFGFPVSLYTFICSSSKSNIVSRNGALIGSSAFAK